MGPNTPNNHTISSEDGKDGNTPALGAGYSASGILSRVVITLLLVPVFVALVIEAIKLDGIAAPVLGR